MKKFIIKYLTIITTCFFIINCSPDILFSLFTNKYRDTSLPIKQRVNALLKEMTIDEKLGQMVMAERKGLQPGDIKKYHLGAVLSGGGSTPLPNTPEAWQKMYNEFQKEALSTRLGIPIIYGVDALHGHGNAIGATIFTHNIGMGATRNSELIKKIVKITAREVKATGLNWNFAPSVAVARDERWGRTFESFGESPELQKIITASYVKAMQEEGIVACAKCYMADGGVDWPNGGREWLTGKNTTMDRGNAIKIDLATLKKIHAQGYIEAVKADTGTIMGSYSMFKGIHMHANKQLLAGYLKAPESEGGLNFKGFVVGDYDAMDFIDEIKGSYADRVLASFNAGIDMSMEGTRWKEVISILKNGLKKGTISQERIDDAVSRILTVKFRFGLFEKPLARNNTKIGTKAHRKIAVQAVHESLVLLKNKNNILPLKKNKKIYVCGPLADHIGAQCGGWTITWQGIDSNSKSQFPGATSILDGIRWVLNENGGKCITDFKKAKSADAAVVVVGELPYCEFYGDIRINGTMQLDDQKSKIAPGCTTAINKAKTLGIPVIVIIISGRPLIITDEIPKWSACIAAWLPGSEGSAVADLLFGDVNFKGKLPITWPRSLKQLPINIGDPGYGKGKRKPLFPYGFGLRMKL